MYCKKNKIWSHFQTPSRGNFPPRHFTLQYNVPPIICGPCHCVKHIFGILYLFWSTTLKAYQQSSTVFRQLNLDSRKKYFQVQDGVQ